MWMLFLDILKNRSLTNEKKKRRIFQNRVKAIKSPQLEFQD